MCYIVINFGFARYIVNVTAATYKKGVFAVVKPLHAGNVSRAVKVGEKAYPHFSASRV